MLSWLMMEEAASSLSARTTLLPSSVITNRITSDSHLPLTQKLLMVFLKPINNSSNTLIVLELTIPKQAKIFNKRLIKIINSISSTKDLTNNSISQCREGTRVPLDITFRGH